MELYEKKSPKTANKHLIVMFNGWGFETFPFAQLDSNGYDIILVYDYNDINLPEKLKNIKGYETKTLITWSMGVFVAYLYKDYFKDFDIKIAINGTTSPVHDNLGIPKKIFELTLKHAQKGLQGKFYKNTLYNDFEWIAFCKNQITRSIENRVSELHQLYKTVKTTEITYEEFYNKVYISKYDKIIPPDNQLFWCKTNNIQYQTLECGHCPFFNYSSWKELIEGELA